MLSHLGQDLQGKKTKLGAGEKSMQECCCRVQLRKEQWETDAEQAAKEHRVEKAVPQSGCSVLSALVCSVASPAVWGF